jgi:hypothetical protein
MPGELLVVAIAVGSVGALVLAAAIVRDILDATEGSRAGEKFW